MSTNSELKRLKGSKTWEDLAKELGVKRQTINNWRNKKSCKAFETLKKFAQLMKEADSNEPR